MLLFVPRWYAQFWNKRVFLIGLGPIWIYFTLCSWICNTNFVCFMLCESRLCYTRAAAAVCCSGDVLSQSAHVRCRSGKISVIWLLPGWHVCVRVIQQSSSSSLQTTIVGPTKIAWCVPSLSKPASLQSRRPPFQFFSHKDITILNTCPY